jgi:phosphatidylglycerophosphatase A
LALPDLSRATWTGRAQWLVATGLGIGQAPVAPGTVGSAAGVVLGWALGAMGWPVLAAGCLVVVAAGLWAAGAVARQLGRPDPGPVVIDEIAGQMLTLLGAPAEPRALVAGFVLFRLFDITKPFPARRVEALPGGSGIMTDDLVAGAYANLALRVVLRLLGD